MEDVPSTLAGGGIGALLLFVAAKYLWPLMKNGMDVQLANGRAESQLLRQIMEERDKAIVRAEAADERSRQMFQELSELKYQVRDLTNSLESARREIARMTEALSTVKANNP